MSLRSVGEQNTARLFEDGLTVRTKTLKIILHGKLTKRPKALGFVHTFRSSTGRQVPIIAGQSSGTQESTGIFTRPGRLNGWEFAGRLSGSTRSYPLLCMAAGR
jgi:hypothetical protein